MNKTHKITLLVTALLLWNGVTFAQSASEQLTFSVMSKQSLKVEKLASQTILQKGIPMEKAIYMVRVRSNDAHKTWHVQSNLVEQGKPVLSGKMGEFTKQVEVLMPLAQKDHQVDFHLVSEV